MTLEFFTFTVVNEHQGPVVELNNVDVGTRVCLQPSVGFTELGMLTR